MKNKIKILSLLSLFALSACGGKTPKTTPTYGGKTPTPTPSVTPTVTPTASDADEWTAEEIAAIEEYMYGVDLPVVGFRGDARLAYDEEYSGLVLSVSDITDGELEEYADKYADTDFTGGYDEEDESYYYVAPVELNDGSTRYVASYFYIMYEEGANYGDFTLYVYDPFYYAFEELNENVLSYLLAILESDAAIPAFDADYYEIDASYLAWGLPYLDVYACGVAANVKETFEKGLTDNKYTITVQPEDNSSLAISPDELFSIAYAYYEEVNIFYVSIAPYVALPEEMEPLANAMEFLLEVLDINMSYDFDVDDEDVYIECTVEGATTAQEVLDPIYKTLVTDKGIEAYDPEYVLANDIGYYTFGDTDYYEFDLLLKEEIYVELYAGADDEGGWLVIDVYFGEVEQTEGEGTVTEEDGIYTAHIDFTKMSDGAVFTSQTVGEATMSIENLSGNSDKDPKFYANGSTLRIYTENDVVFSVSEGYEITEVKVTISEDTGSKVRDFSVIEVANGTSSVEDRTCTITPTDGADDVSFLVTGTSGHLRITDISISYKLAE